LFFDRECLQNAFLRSKRIVIDGVYLSASQTKTNFKKLTPEEEQIIVNKGTEMPFQENITRSGKKAPMSANDAAQNYTTPNTSSKLTAAGQASTTKFPVQ
jgi:hypothetical protein